MMSSGWFDLGKSGRERRDESDYFPMSHSERSETAAETRRLNLGKFASPAPAAGNEREGQTAFLHRVAAETVERSLGPEAATNTEFGLPLKQMLGIITYCYARGLFCSPDIARHLRSDPELRRPFGRSLPDAEAIRRFRRQYAAEIEDTLESLYRAFPVPDTENPGTSADTEIIQRQAAERLHDASWADNTRGRIG